MYYIKFEVSQEKIKEYIGPKDNNIYYGLEINHKDHNISHIVARKENDLYIISFYEWIYNIEKDLHWLKEFDNIMFNGDRCIFDYGKIKDKILEKYPGLEILKTEVFDSKDKLIDKTPDRITFDEELERHKMPYDVDLDIKSEIERIEEEKRIEKLLKKAFGPKTKYKNKISIKNCNGNVGNIIQNSNIKIDNIEFESDDFSDLLEKNPMNFDEMHFKTEEEKEEEYIKNELKKAKCFNNHSIIKKLFDLKEGFFKYNLDLIICFLFMLLSMFGIMESDFKGYLFSFSLGSIVGCLIYFGIKMY